MCTIGVAARDRTGNVRSFMLKTADTWPQLKVHHGIEASEDGSQRLSLSFESQRGVNSGMN